MKNNNNKIKIVKAEENHLEFSDGSYIIAYHDRDCCEHNYADFEQIDDLAWDWEFEWPLQFTSDEYGFLFGNPGKMVWVPCYSEQDGYYSSNIDVCYFDATAEICEHYNFECVVGW